MAGEPQGVRLSVLQTLRDDANELSLSQGPIRTWRPWENPPSRRPPGTALTTEDVCHEIVIPRTASLQCSFYDLLEPAQRGQAVHFVSHAWQVPFPELVDALSSAASRDGDAEPDPCLWFDLVLNSQHGTAERPFSWWTGTFLNSIKAIGSVLLVLYPWHDPLPLTRSWCLYEVHAAIATGCKLYVVLPPSQTDAFESALVNRYESIGRSLAAISLERAQAASEADRTAILEAAASAPGGIHELNVQVLGRLRAWLVGCARERAAGYADLARATGYANSTRSSVADVRAESGTSPGGAHVLRAPPSADADATVAGGAARRTSLPASGSVPTDPPSSAEALIASAFAASLARLVFEQGETSEACALAERELAERERVHGRAHYRSQEMVAQLANLRSSEGRHAEAEALAEECWAHARERLLAAVGAAQEVQAAAAEQQLRSGLGPSEAEQAAVDDAVAAVSAASMLFIPVAGCLGVVRSLHARQLLARAAAACEAEAAAADADGASAELAGASAAAMAEAMWKAHVAEEDLQDALHHTMAAVPGDSGKFHPATLTWLSALANLLDEFPGGRRREDALVLYEWLVLGHELAHGESHPKTLGGVYNRACALEAVGREDEAEPMLERALRGWELTLGVSHPDTSMCRAALARVQSRRSPGGT
jgi:tetratricopeptide (TPR) repeat protein